MTPTIRRLVTLLTIALALPTLAAPPPSRDGGPRAQRRPLDFEVLRSVRDVGAPVLSPDGTRVVYPLTEPAEDGGRRSELWIVDVAPGASPRQLTRDRGRVAAPAWSPEGDRVAFLSAGQVWVASVSDDGAPRRVTALAGGVSAFAWAPGGDRLAVVSPRVDADGDRLGGEHVHVVNVASGQARRVSPEVGYSLAIAWSPDGRGLAYSTQAGPGFYAALETDLFLLELGGGAPRPLVVRPGVDGRPEFSPDGGTIAFISGFGRSGLLPSMGIALVDVASGEVRDVGRAHERGGFFEGPTRLEWGPDGDAVYSNASYGIGERIVRLDVASGETELFGDGPLSYGALDVAADAPRMALLVSDYDMPGEVHVTSLRAFAPERLTRSNPHLDDVAFPEAEIVRWPAPDGTEITGLLVLPPGGIGDRPLPLLVSLHGGPATSVGVGYPGLGFFYNPYRDDLLASRGYAVLLPNPRGSGGFGEEFRRAAAGDWGRGPLADVMAGVDRLVDDGIADPERLGVMGWSYGGYLAAWTITATDRFRAASVGAGVFDLESHFGQAAEQMLEYFGGPPWEVPGAYADDSPSSYVDRVVTPTQVIHGGADTSVSPAQAQYLAASLRTLGVPHEVLLYPEEGHSLRDPDVQEESWRRVLAWFDRWVRDEPGGGGMERRSR